MFWHFIDKQHWPTDADYLHSIAQSSQAPYGDCRQEFVFIGQGLSQSAMITALDDCLLSDVEMNLGVEHWLTFADPFPTWQESHDESTVAEQANQTEQEAVLVGDLA